MSVKNGSESTHRSRRSAQRGCEMVVEAVRVCRGRMKVNEWPVTSQKSAYRGSESVNRDHESFDRALRC